MDQPLQRFTIQEMLKELREAEYENRTADFSNKLLPEFSFSDKEINASLDFKGSTIQGAVYFNNCKINGFFNLENALIYTTLYIANSKILGDFIAKKARIREVVNLIASNFRKNINFENINIKGFIGMDRIRTKGNINLSKAIVRDIVTKTGTIRGDIYLREAEIGGFVNLEGVYAEGLGSFENSTIVEDLKLRNAHFKEVVILTGTIIEGDVDAQDMQCKNLIAHMT